MNGSGGAVKAATVNESILTDDDCLPPGALLANDAMYPTTQALISDVPKPPSSTSSAPSNLRPLNVDLGQHCVTEVSEARHVNSAAPHQQRYLKESSGYASSNVVPAQAASRPMAFVRSLNNDGLEPTKRSSTGSNRRDNVRFASADTLHEDQEYKISV